MKTHCEKNMFIDLLVRGPFPVAIKVMSIDLLDKVMSTDLAKVMFLN